jgi:SAM-dependent methyltransferase
MALANPQARITALDLSAGSLGRAKLHCLIHLRRNVDFVRGDLLDPAVAPGPFHFIDAFGVLHHLEDPTAGLRALEERLAPGGIIRVMLYGRYARKEAESIRRAMKLLGVTNVQELKKLLRRAKPGGRVRGYLDCSWEARSDCGLADLFLHPCVHTYRIDDFLELLGQTGLQPLLFGHQDALADPAAEIERLRRLDVRKETPTNIICYLGKTAAALPCPGDDTFLRLNPSLLGTVSSPTFLPVTVTPRLGRDNPLLDRKARAFLRKFQKPIRFDALTADEQARTRSFLDALFLVAYRL